VHGLVNSITNKKGQNKMETKENLQTLYNHLPKELRDQVVEINEEFERIGPFQLPIELPSGEIVFFTVNHYFMRNTNHRYYVVTKNGKFKNPVLRIESVCNYAHIFNSRRCDCRFQLFNALEKIHKEGDGLVVFCLDQHGKALPEGTRGHALVYALGQLQHQDLIHDAYVKNGFKEDYRDYTDVKIILKSLGISKVRLMTNSPHRLNFLKENGFTVTHIPLEKDMEPWVCEELHFKKEKLNHLLDCIGFKPEFLEKYGLKPAWEGENNGSEQDN